MSNSPLDLSSLGQYKTIIIALAVFMLFLIIFCLILWLPYILPPGSVETPTPGGIGWHPSTCEDLLGKAMDASYKGCQLIGSNQICYGNNDVNAQLTDGSLSQFASLGDTIPVNDLLTLSTAPMDLNHDIWGIAVFKLQANLPGTVPGQNVSFLVFGDTGLYNYSGDMYSIYFSTGIGSVTCSQVPDGLKVDVPEGSGVVFNANGAEISLQGDSVLTANPGETMTVTMLNGSGVVTSDGQSQSLVAGEYVSVPLSEDLKSTGPPSLPLPLSEEEAYALCLLTGENCDDPLTIFDPPTTEVVGITDPETDTPDPDAPIVTTEAPIVTTEAPIVTTEAPIVTTEAPIVTTEAPIVTTEAPPAGTCGNVNLGGYSKSGNTVSINITNNNASAVVLNRIELSWNQSTNGQLDELKFDTKRMWGQSADANSPANLTLSPAVPQRTLDAGATGTLDFIFMNGTVSNLTMLKVHLDIGCFVQK